MESQVKVMAVGEGWREGDVDLEFTHMLVGQREVGEKTGSKMTSRFCAWVSECVEKPLPETRNRE